MAIFRSELEPVKHSVIEFLKNLVERDTGFDDIEGSIVTLSWSALPEDPKKTALEIYETGPHPINFANTLYITESDEGQELEVSFNRWPADKPFQSCFPLAGVVETLAEIKKEDDGYGVNTKLQGDKAKKVLDIVADTLKKALSKKYFLS